MHILAWISIYVCLSAAAAWIFCRSVAWADRSPKLTVGDVEVEGRNLEEAADLLTLARP